MKEEEEEEEEGVASCGCSLLEILEELSSLYMGRGGRDGGMAGAPD